MVDEIAREMSVPKSFLAKIVQKLSRAGIVESFVGIQGGFRLSKKPREISLYDVITAIEGPVAMNKCTVSKKNCSLSRTCKIHPIWIRVRNEIEDILKKSTFQKIRSAR
jgi:Rrf2 family protein